MTAVRARSLALDASAVVGGAAVTALASQVSVPVWPVPFTLQTLAVLGCGLAFGARRGAAAQATYLAMGLAGLPVFAEAKAGPFWAFPTGGYLMAFVLVAAIAGWAAERFGKGWRLALALVAANLALLGLGAAYLSAFVGPSAFEVGFLRFLPSAVAQSVAAWLTVRGIASLNGRD